MGQRLWPVSREATPKPFMRVAGRSLLQHTVARASDFSFTLGDAGNRHQRQLPCAWQTNRPGRLMLSTFVTERGELWES